MLVFLLRLLGVKRLWIEEKRNDRTVRRVKIIGGDDWNKPKRGK